MGFLFFPLRVVLSNSKFGALEGRIAFASHDCHHGILFTVAALRGQREGVG
jgi:hypothetical protein